MTSQRIDLSAELKEFVLRRAHFALGRFNGRITGLSIRLTDVNGPRNGVDKACDIRISPDAGSVVIVREQRENIYAAVSHALDRAARAVQRKLSLGRASA
jgi:ribosome-associated translation inhibitor RaiA